MDLTIATFNIQNKYKIKKYNGIDEYGDHAIDLKKMIYEKNIDIIGVQELTRRFRNRLRLIINDYTIVGRMRYTRFGRFIPILDKFNESTSVISKYPILKANTKYLSYSLPIPRIVTIVKYAIGNKKIDFINTHLTHNNPKRRKKELIRLVKILKKSENAILTGDFNITINNPDFKYFINKLNKIGYKRISINESTHKISKSAIDHIFVHKSIKVKKVNLCRIDNNISDHKAIIAQLVI